MRRILAKLSIFALTFGLGVGVSACWQLYQWSLLSLDVGDQIDGKVATVDGSATAISIVGGMHACGPSANFHTTELSDGTYISQSCERLRSPAIAARALKERLVNAEIAERREERDEKGRLIGESILITSPRVARLTIHGNSLCETQAPSITHLQLYEDGALRVPLNTRETINPAR